MVNTRFIGIDGCRFGWVIAVLENDLKLYLVKKISEFTYTEKDSIWVDMSIGLDASKERICDLELKKAMGKKKSSVFMTPVKDAVYASNYHTASALNFDKTGKKLSIQSWNICNKIAELDSYLFKQTSVFRKKFKESHPEYLFQNVSNKEIETKKSDTGINQRKNLISKFIENTAAVQSFIQAQKKSDCKIDDVLDAIILAIAAKRAESEKLYYYGDENAKIYWL